MSWYNISFFPCFPKLENECLFEWLLVLFLGRVAAFKDSTWKARLQWSALAAFGVQDAPLQGQGLHKPQPWTPL